MPSRRSAHSQCPSARPPATLRWWQPFAGGALAAGVAAASLLWLRAQVPLSSAPLSAQRASPELASPALALANVAASGDNSYVTPRAPPVRAMLVPSTQLANYVVAHSMFSSPVARRNLLSAFITSEQAAGSVEEVVRDAPSDAR